jgi:hypothetical protein
MNKTTAVILSILLSGAALAQTTTQAVLPAPPAAPAVIGRVAPTPAVQPAAQAPAAQAPAPAKATDSKTPSTKKASKKNKKNKKSKKNSAAAKADAK